MSELVVIGREKSPAELANLERPTYVKAGTGGKIIKHRGLIGTPKGAVLQAEIERLKRANIDPEERAAKLKMLDTQLHGQVCGPIAGEALRLALARGAVIIGEEPVETTRGKSVPQQQADAQAEETATTLNVASMFGR